MTKTVNIKKEKYTLYIGRKNLYYNEPVDSKWANKYVIGKDGTREECIEKYRLWINSQPDLLQSLPELKSQILGCYCAPDFACHGEILIELCESKYIKNWFSNMLPFEQPLFYQEIKFETVENFYQAMKLPKDRIDLRSEIAQMSPYEAKKNIRNKNKYKWDEKMANETYGTTRKLEIMRYALEWKFQKGTDWYRKLMITKDLNLELVEWNNWNDIFWGKNIKTKEGHNYLGKILMRIRDK